MQIILIDTTYKKQKKELIKLGYKHKEKVLVYNWDFEDRTFPINKSACNFKIRNQDSVISFYNIRDMYGLINGAKKSLPNREFKIIKYNNMELYLLDLNFKDAKRIYRFKRIN